MKEIGRNKFDPIHLCAGDSIVLTITESGRLGKKTVLAEATITAEQVMTVDETVLFQTMFERRRALGGMVVAEVEK